MLGQGAGLRAYGSLKVASGLCGGCGQILAPGLLGFRAREGFMV